MFLQAGFPLKITLYKYAPASQGVQLLYTKGTTLDLNEFLAVSRSSSTLTVVAQDELTLLMAQSTAEFAHIDQMSEVA